MLAILIAAIAAQLAIGQPLRGRVTGPSFVAGHVTATASARLRSAGRYVVVVTLRARRAHQLVTLVVPGQSRRELYADRSHATRLSFRLSLGSRVLHVRAISIAPAVHIAMTVKQVAVPPAPKVAAAPTTTTTSASTTSTPPPPTPPPPAPPPPAPPPPPPSPAPSGPPANPDGLTPVPSFDHGQTPIFYDNFAGTAGTAPDPSKWNLDTSNPGCGDGTQSENYPQNATLVGPGGGLQITARANGSGSFASAQIDSAGHFSANGGTIEASIVLPAGQGLCSAFWLVGDNQSAGWPNYGEIDVVEALGNPGIDQYRSFADVHGPVGTPDGGNDQEFENYWDWPSPLTGVAHVYAINWTASEITWTLDGVPYASVSEAQMSALHNGWAGIFDGSETFHIVFDLAVGGWPGPANASLNSATLLVNWVKVFQ